MIDAINAAPDYGAEPPIACSSFIDVLGAQFDCGGTPGHAGKHTFDCGGGSILPKMHVEWTDEEAEPRGTETAGARIRRWTETLHRLASEDTCVLDEGLGGGPQEELHVRANLARLALGYPVCGCTECQVSLGLEPDDDYPDVSGGGVPYPASADVDL